jgi:cytochrome c
MSRPRLGPLAAAIKLATILGAILGTAGCSDSPSPITVPGGDATRGRGIVAERQCGACHIVPGIRSARGRVGPTLARFAHRPYLAGKWPNDPEHLVRWLRDPPAMAPHTAMPAVLPDDAAARDAAAFLYTLR